MVVDGKAKTKGKERRVFLFEKIIIFSEPMTREGGLPEFRYVHNMKVNITLIHLYIISIVILDNSNLEIEKGSSCREVRTNDWVLGKYGDYLVYFNSDSAHCDQI